MGLLLPRHINAVVSLSPTTTIAKERDNNTSACGTDYQSKAYCDQAYGPFLGWTDRRTGATVLTNPYNIAPANTSKGRGSFGDIHNLLPAGMQDVPVFAHMQSWFSGPQSRTETNDGVVYPATSGHKMNGVIDCTWQVDCATTGLSIARARAQAVLKDLWERGYDGLFADWSGGRNTCGNGTRNFSQSCGIADSLYRRDVQHQLLMDEMAANYPSMKYGIIYTESGIKFGNNCGPGSGYDDGEAKQMEQVKCVEGKLRADMAYARDHYFNQPVYWKVNNQPVIGWFVCETCEIVFSQCTSANPCFFTDNTTTCTSGSGCWSTLWTRLKSYTQNTLGVNIKFIFRHSTGMTKTSSDGGFQWKEPRPESGSAITVESQEDWRRKDNPADPNSDTYVTRFYRVGSQEWDNGKVIVALAKKGVDFRNASWHYQTSDSVTAQQCGQVWLDSFLEMARNNYFTPSKKPHAINVGTWDDYEEGSEVETGIDNCWRVNGSMSSGILNWSLTATDNRYAQLRTLDHLTVFVTTDGVNLTPVVDGIPPSAAGTVDLNTLNLPAGSYTLWVKAWGKPGLRNDISQVGTFTVTSTGGGLPQQPPPQATPPSEGGAPPTPKPKPVNPRTTGTKGITIL